VNRSKEASFTPLGALTSAPLPTATLVRVTWASQALMATKPPQVPVFPVKEPPVMLWVPA
jgi:hypothetical protein